MKILFIVKKWEGGVGNVIKGYEKYLTRRGHKVYTISREDDLGCTSFKGSIRKLRRAVKKRDYDRIVTNDWSLALPLIFPFPLKVKKHYCIFHAIQPGSIISFIFQGYIGWIMETFGKLIVVGPTLKKKFKLAKPVYNGIDLDIFKVNKSKEFNGDNIGFANWPTEQYNYDKIYDSVKLYGNELMLAKGLNKKQMSAFYNELGVFISLPYDGAGYNLVWAEALACGVPKIIGRKVGIGEELPIHHIEGDITIDNIMKALEQAKNIPIDVRDKYLNKISLERATDDLEKALNVNGEKKDQEKGQEDQEKGQKDQEKGQEDQEKGQKDQEKGQEDQEKGQEEE